MDRLEEARVALRRWRTARRIEATASERVTEVLVAEVARLAKEKGGPVFFSSDVAATWPYGTKVLMAGMRRAGGLGEQLEYRLTTWDPRQAANHGTLFTHFAKLPDVLPELPADASDG